MFLAAATAVVFPAIATAVVSLAFFHAAITVLLKVCLFVFFY